MAKKNNLLIWGFGVGVALMIFLVTLLGVDTFYPRPEWDDYCDPLDPVIREGEEPVPIDFNEECRDEFDEARGKYDLVIFFIFVIIGLVLVIASLFIDILFVEVATMLSGFILMVTGLARNFDNKQLALITSIIILVSLIVIGNRKIKR